MRLSSGSVWESEVGYCRLVRAGSMIEVSGTVASDEDGNIIGEGDAYCQTLYCLKKIEKYLNEAGALKSDIIRTRIYVTGIREWAEIGKAHAEFFKSMPPASSMIQVAGLVDPGFLVEIEARAICQDENQPGGHFTYRFPRPALTADSLIYRRGKRGTAVLLIKRKKPPYKDKWALPGGFIEIDEDLADAAARELQEETGLSGISLSQFRTYGSPGRDPRGRTISVVFTGWVDEQGNQGIQAGDDAADVAWFETGELPDLAFDHGTIIKEALAVVQSDSLLRE